MTLNRLSGLVVTLAGIILLFWIIPNQTETVALGWLKPNTLPNIITIVIIILGLFHFILPSGKAEFDIKLALRIGLFFMITMASLYFMSVVGFLIAAPTMVMIVMILIGERRPLWLVSGIVLGPAAIWATVDLLLNRPLP
jgi:putative tricarboxylic transport membrane protein